MRKLGWMPVVGMFLAAACSDNGGDVNEPPANTAPTAEFGVVCVQRVCTFTDNSTDNESSIKSWAWDFGDGQTSPEQNPVHEYAAVQDYNATLVVTDSLGLTGTVTHTATTTAPPTADLVCADAAAPGTSATCTFTLPEDGSVQATLGPPKPCGAVGDVLAFSAPVADTLTADACFAAAGTQSTLAPQPAGTVVTFEMRGGLTDFSTGVQVTGVYPSWTLHVEDALGAPFNPVPDFADLVVTLAVVPSGQ